MGIIRFIKPLLCTVAKLSLFSVLLACQTPDFGEKPTEEIKEISAEKTKEKTPAIAPHLAGDAPVFLLHKPAESFVLPDKNADQAPGFKTIERRGTGGFIKIPKPGFMPLKQ